MISPTIRFVVPYFGVWPAWISLFLESVKWNPTIEWLFFSDCAPIHGKPDNVKVIPISFFDYCNLVSKKLDIAFCPSNPYKLCDLKPAYGYIHAEELRDVEFWGFCDIDVIFGNLRAYFTPERLKDKDLLSTHARRVSGHLCLVRNTPSLNRLFTLVPDWRNLFSDDRHRAFDEGAFSRLFLRHKNLPQFMATFLGTLTNARFRRAEFRESFSTPNARIDWHDGSRNFPTRWRWKRGILTNDRDGSRAYPYFHFFVWKRAWGKSGELSISRLPTNKEITEFEISEHGFIAPL